MSADERRRLRELGRGYNATWLRALCSCGHSRALHDGAPEARDNRCWEAACPCERYEAQSLSDALRQLDRDVDDPVRRELIAGQLRERARLLDPPSYTDWGTRQETLERIRLRNLPGNYMTEPDPAPTIRVKRPDVQIAPREGTTSRCPFCHEGEFETVPALRCKSCNAWQHAECVGESRRRLCGACKEPFPHA